jgi:hypothetical protein
MTREHAAEGVDSPLRLRRRTTFNAVRFGAIALAPEVAALRRDLANCLAAVLVRLPRAMWGEALSTVDRYAGGAGHFYELFHVPVWSFLHWVPAAAGASLDPAMLDHARATQSLGLFLHLWDDHLCDGQLGVDPLRLQIRTEVSTCWRRTLASPR